MPSCIRNHRFRRISGTTVRRISESRFRRRGGIGVLTSLGHVRQPSGFDHCHRGPPMSLSPLLGAHARADGPRPGSLHTLTPSIMRVHVQAGPADGREPERGASFASLSRQSPTRGAHAVVEVQDGCGPFWAVDPRGSRFAEVCATTHMGRVKQRERKGIPCSPRNLPQLPRSLMWEVARGDGTSQCNVSLVPEQQRPRSLTNKVPRLLTSLEA